MLRRRPNEGRRWFQRGAADPDSVIDAVAVQVGDAPEDAFRCASAPASFSRGGRFFAGNARIWREQTERHGRCTAQYVPVAQLDRASDYGSEGRGFESSRARYGKRPDVAQRDDVGAFFVSYGYADQNRFAQFLGFAGLIRTFLCKNCIETSIFTGVFFHLCINCIETPVSMQFMHGVTRKIFRLCKNRIINPVSMHFMHSSFFGRLVDQGYSPPCFLLSPP